MERDQEREREREKARVRESRYNGLVFEGKRNSNSFFREREERRESVGEILLANRERKQERESERDNTRDKCA